MARSAPARRWVVVAVVALLGLIVGAGPAAAHADLESTSPAVGSELNSEPGSVVLSFSEAVSLPTRAIIVLDGASHRVDTGATTHPGRIESAAAVGLRPGLPDGSYLVVWHITSDDGHPVSGNFTFGIGVPAAPPPTAPAANPDPRTTAAHWLAQFTALAGTLVLLGAVLVLVVIWPAGRSFPAAQRVVATAWWAALTGTVVHLAVGAAYGAGGGPADLLTTATLSGMAATTAGRLGLLRVAVLVAGAVIWRRAGRSRRLPGRLEVAGLWLLTVETFSFAGHAGHGAVPLLASTVDVLHLSGAGAWVGGLVVLAVGVLPVPAQASARVPVTSGAPATVSEREVPQEIGPVLVRWSRLATVSVALVAATGAFSALRDVGSWGALGGTTYGRLVLAKAALFAVVLLVASFSHRLVRRWAGAAPGTLLATRLRRLVLTESTIALAILGVTAALVSTAPAAGTYLPSFTTTVTGHAATGEQVVVNLLIRPTRPGFEGLTIHASTQAGQAVPITTANMTFLNRGTGIGPMDFPAPTTPGGGVEDTIISVPGPGQWEVSMRLRIDQRWYAASTDYEVG